MPKYPTVYRRKSQGADYPRVGLPDSLQPGDILTIFIDGAYHTRICASVHRGYVITEKMVWRGYSLDQARKVPWEDIDTAVRPPPLATVESPPPEPPLPVPEPAPAAAPVPSPPPPKTTPAKGRKKPPASKEEDILDLWASLKED